MIYIQSAIFNFLVYALIPIFGIFGLPFAVYSREGAYGVMRGYSHTILWLLKVICGTGYEVRGPYPMGKLCSVRSISRLSIWC